MKFTKHYTIMNDFSDSTFRVCPCCAKSCIILKIFITEVLIDSLFDDLIFFSN